MNPPGSSVLHDLVGWLRERYAPHPDGWWDVDISEDEEVVAFDEGRPDPAAPYTAGELETLVYLARVRAVRTEQLARHRRCFWNAVFWMVVGGVWVAGARVALVRQAKRGAWLRGSGILVVCGGVRLRCWLVPRRHTAPPRAAPDG